MLYTHLIFNSHVLRMICMNMIRHHVTRNFLKSEPQSGLTNLQEEVTVLTERYGVCTHSLCYSLPRSPKYQLSHGNEPISKGGSECRGALGDESQGRLVEMKALRTKSSARNALWARRTLKYGLQCSSRFMLDCNVPADGISSFTPLPCAGRLTTTSPASNSL